MGKNTLKQPNLMRRKDTNKLGYQTLVEQAQQVPCLQWRGELLYCTPHRTCMPADSQQRVTLLQQREESLS